MGFIGAAAGVALGIAIQFTLPVAIKDFLPVDVSVTLDWRAIAHGTRDRRVGRAGVRAAAAARAAACVAAAGAAARHGGARRRAQQGHSDAPREHRARGERAAARVPARGQPAARRDVRRGNRRQHARALAERGGALVARAPGRDGALAVRRPPGRREPVPAGEPNAFGRARARVRRISREHAVSRAGESAQAVRSHRGAVEGEPDFLRHSGRSARGTRLDPHERRPARARHTRRSSR